MLMIDINHQEEVPSFQWSHPENSNLDWPSALHEPRIRFRVKTRPTVFCDFCMARVRQGRGQEFSDGG